MFKIDQVISVNQKTMSHSFSENINENLKNFISFLKNPTDQKGAELTFLERLKNVLAFIILEMPVLLLLIGIISGLEKLEWIDTENHSIQEMMKTIPIPLFFILAVFIIPLFEELIFRLYLRYQYNSVIQIILGFASFGGTAARQKTNDKLQTIWTKYYATVFFISALLFGFIHIFNFEITVNVLLLSPLLVAPQIMMGLITGFLRVKQGFLAGYMMHAIHNAIFIGISILGMNSMMINVDENTPKYSIKIEQNKDAFSDASYKNYVDSLAYTNTTIKTLLARVLQTSEQLIDVNDSLETTKTYSFHFKNKTKDTLQTRKIALEQLKKHLGFTIIKKNFEKESWNMSIVNPDLLAKSLATDPKITTSTTISPKEIRIENGSLAALAYAISNHKKILFNDETPNTKNKYNITLNSDSLDKIIQQLESQYGLKVAKTKEKKEVYLIEFKENKES